MAKVCVLGHFGEGEVLLNGQTVKTKIVTEELIAQLGEEQVVKIDTHGGAKVLLKAPFAVLGALKKSANVLIFPAHNGLRVYAPLLAMLRPFFKGRKLHYSVIGGWLPTFLEKRRFLKKCLMKFDGIYAETNTMKNALDAMGFKNVGVVPNCKKLGILSSGELVYPEDTPYRLCTFSRVMKEKGIGTAMDAITRVNERLGYVAYSLDIYGQVDAGQTEWFEELKGRSPEYVRYCGCVDANESVAVLKDYFALLFPTHFYTEGIPGTVIDAYAAGIPVISAKWESYSDVIDEGVTGMGYTFDAVDELEEILVRAAEDKELLLSLKENCIKRAEDFLPSAAIKAMLENFGQI
ncbi:MAG: glycosyltransferase [Ruminococcaceae bacterium]|nr:glycosyltransferase [Oscillospiraceae bacterium]